MFDVAHHNLHHVVINHHFCVLILLPTPKYSLSFILMLSKDRKWKHTKLKTKFKKLIFIYNNLLLSKLRFKQNYFIKKIFLGMSCSKRTFDK